jgi:tRNA G18 (ribose-2'-O)-methylase SpoU
MRKLKNNELGRITVAAFKAVQKTPIIVILDNIGSVFRTSDAFLIEKIYL